MIKKDEILENIAVTAMSSEGKGIARQDNFVVFIEGAIPGDVVDVRIYKKKKSFAEGRAVFIHKSSDDRVKPFCEHFGICGGCKLQHISYNAQLSFKTQQVIDALERIGKLDVKNFSEIAGSSLQTCYRNKLEYTFSHKGWLTKTELENEDVISNPALGFHIPLRFDKILDIKKCYLQDDLTNQIRLEVRKYCIENDLSFFDLREQTGFMRNLIIRNTSLGEWMVIVIFHSEVAHSRIGLLDHLQNKFPQITSLQYVINPKRNDTISDLEVFNYSGKEEILEKMENISFRISAKSFFQTNSLQACKLYQIVREYADLKGEENVYDLYTGTGTIALFLARHARHVTGIDYVEASIADAHQNALFNNISNVSFFAGDMKDVLNNYFINKHGRPDVIVTDPPRSGMHESVVDAIRLAAPSTIVYVSCNPSTQARDLQLLSGEYRIERVQPVDMFPHTTHVENVVKLVRNQNENP